MVNVDALGGTSWLLASPADESKRTKRVQGWLCKFRYISQQHCFIRKPRACRTRFVVLFLASKTLFIDRNHLEPAIYITMRSVVLFCSDRFICKFELSEARNC